MLNRKGLVRSSTTFSTASVKGGPGCDSGAAPRPREATESQDREEALVSAVCLRHSRSRYSFGTCCSCERRHRSHERCADSPDKMGAHSVFRDLQQLGAGGLLPSV